MLIICAKFRIAGVENTNTRDKDKDSLLRDIGLDSSIASDEGNRSGNNDGWLQERRIDRKMERNAEWQRSRDLESSLVKKSLPPPRKSSLPGLGHGLTMLSSGGNITPSGSIFGGFFGNRDKDDDKVEKYEKQDGSDVKDEEEKSKHEPGDSIRSPSLGLTILKGNPDDHIGLSIQPPKTKDLKRVNLLVNTAALEMDVGVLPALSSPDYDRRLDEGRTFQDDRRAGYGCDDKYKRADREQKGRRMNEDRFEWVVLDMGTEIGKSNFTRTFHYLIA
jgi:hypothetical protein